jgi:hypothetical protein
MTLSVTFLNTNAIWSPIPSREPQAGRRLHFLVLENCFTRDEPRHTESNYRTSLKAELGFVSGVNPENMATGEPIDTRQDDVSTDVVDSISYFV